MTQRAGRHRGFTLRSFCSKFSEFQAFTNYDKRLGSPVLSRNDNSMVGVLSYGAGDDPRDIVSQVFTHLPFYYQWIAHVTGLEIPKCHGPQEPVQPF